MKDKIEIDGIKYEKIKSESPLDDFKGIVKTCAVKYCDGNNWKYDELSETVFKSIGNVEIACNNNGYSTLIKNKELIVVEKGRDILIYKVKK